MVIACHHFLRCASTYSTAGLLLIQCETDIIVIAIYDLMAVELSTTYSTYMVSFCLLCLNQPVHPPKCLILSSQHESHFPVRQFVMIAAVQPRDAFTSRRQEFTVRIRFAWVGEALYKCIGIQPGFELVFISERKKKYLSMPTR